MGSQDVRTSADGKQRRRFMRHLFNDLHALEAMLSSDMFERGVRRIGAEQELFLVDHSWRPQCAALEVLEALEDPHFTTELGLFNLELNMDPLVFGGDCLSRMEDELSGRLDRLREVARALDIHPVLTGILPTLRKSHLGLDSMTPLPRYAALNEAMNALRGGAYEFYIKGLDELRVNHDSVMLEACNASFQVHFQVEADEFANLYNVSQAAAAPVLAAAVNSPLLFGLRLWSETRIALFQQAVETFSSIEDVRNQRPRVTFGTRWVCESVLELFQEDIANFRTLVIRDIKGDSLADLARGEIPRLSALCLHNSTVYRWNRACYGITEGRPHLRIENRILPSGPTVVDEVANAAFWFGLISGLSAKFEDITQVMRFEDAAVNFTSAARQGLEAQLSWLHGAAQPADRLIRDRLLPLAAEGLAQSGIDDADAKRYLGIIDERVAGRATGADWQKRSLIAMGGNRSSGERLNALTAAMVARQAEGRPVSQWEPARLDEAGGWKHNFLKVEQYMTRELFTVGEDESLDLVAYLMEWKHIRYVPVEDREHRLVGLVSIHSLLRTLSRGLHNRTRQLAVAEVMKQAPITIAPEDSTLRAIELMRDHGVGCLPVVARDRLVGMITERDLMQVASELLEEHLKE